MAGEIKQWYLLLGEGNAILVVIIGFQRFVGRFYWLKLIFSIIAVTLINIEDFVAPYDNARDPWWR